MIKSAAQPTGKKANKSLYSELEHIRQEVVREGEAMFKIWKPLIKRSTFLPSAMNLGHFIALRRMDLRETQATLMLMGLSSLGHCESHFLSNLDAIMATLSGLVKGLGPRARPPRKNRRVRIMATLPV